MFKSSGPQPELHKQEKPDDGRVAMKEDTIAIMEEHGSDTTREMFVKEDVKRPSLNNTKTPSKLSLALKTSVSNDKSSSQQEQEQGLQIRSQLQEKVVTSIQTETQAQAQAQTQTQGQECNHNYKKKLHIEVDHEIETGPESTSFDFPENIPVHFIWLPHKGNNNNNPHHKLKHHRYNCPMVNR